MSNIAQSDIFFFIASILLTLATVVFIVAIIYVIKLLREARSIAAIIRQEADLLSEDLRTIRAKVRTEGISAGRALSFVSGFFKGRRGRKGRS
jgi:hypothetical protein